MSDDIPMCDFCEREAVHLDDAGVDRCDHCLEK